MIRYRSFLGAILLATACSTPPPAATGTSPGGPATTSLDAPAAPGSAAFNLSTAPDGRVFLTWMEPGSGGGHVFRFASRRADNPWSEPGTIAQGKDFFVNAADVPSLLALDGDTLVAHWPARYVAGTEAAHIMVARSTNGGATWAPPVIPYRDRSRQQHGFVTLLPGPDRGVHVIWLDGRHTKGEGMGDMALMHTLLPANGRLGAERQIDARACDCCQTSAVATVDGVLLAYRDRSDQEVRDIVVTRFDGRTWSAPAKVADDKWLIFGCPVNGPSLSANGSTVALAWFTEALEQPHVSVVLSRDGGRTFSRPTQVSGEKSLGRVQAAALPDGGALVSWVESVELGTELRLRRIAADGKAGEAWTVVPSSAFAVRTYPRMAYADGEITIAWTDAATPARLMTATLKLPG